MIILYQMRGMENLRAFVVGIMALLPFGLAAQTLDFERDSLLRDLPYPNLLNVLASQIPGFSISPVDDAEGDESASMTLRGLNLNPSNTYLLTPGSLNAPLIVVDGLVYNGSINEINTADVSKVEVIKDAAGLYGSRAANGAILITTRKGTVGRPVVRFRAGAGFSDWSHRPQGANEEWTDLISRKGIGQQYDVSVSGGIPTLDYYASGNFTRQQGILRGDDYQKFNGLAWIGYHPLPWLQIGAQARYTDGRRWGQTPRLQNAFWMGSKTTRFSEVPGYEDWPNVWPDGHTVHPLIGSKEFESCLYTDRHSQGRYFDGTVHAAVAFPFLEGLSFRSVYHFRDEKWNENTSDDPRRFVNTNYADDMDHPEKFAQLVGNKVSERTATDGDWENVLGFRKEFGLHRLALSAAYGREKWSLQQGNKYYRGSSASPTEEYSSSTEYVFGRLSGGLSYQYDARYFADLNISWENLSRDSHFSYGTLSPASVSQLCYQAKLGWAPVKEIIKLYASYGAGEYKESSGMPSIRRIEGGMDFTLPEGRLSGSLQVYSNLSRYEGKEYALIVDDAAGDNAISNRGVEFALRSLNVAGDGIRGFRWESQLLLSVNRNRVERLNGKTENAFDIANASAYGYDFYYALGVGYPLSGIYSLPEHGSDIVFLGDRDPSLTLNLGNTLSWQKVSLWFNLRWMYGGADHFLGYDTVAQKWTSRNFLKLSDLVLSYDVLRHLRVYLSGANLLTFTQWPALDPENGGTIPPAAASDRFLSFPTFRSLRLGVQLSF